MTSAIVPASSDRRGSNSRANDTFTAEQQHQRDYDTLARLFAILDTQWVDAFLEMLRNERILDDAEVHYHRFRGVSGESRFWLFDNRTRRLICEFAAAWERVHDLTFFGDVVDGAPYARFRPEVYSVNETGRTARELCQDLQAARDIMATRFRAMIGRVQRQFPELDFVESDRRARELFESR